jgi:hypothetical protein
MKRVFVLICCLLIALSLRAQRTDSSIFALPVQMDEVTITAARSGWDVAGFIRRVQTDTTFYKAFRSLHLVPYTGRHQVQIFDRRGRLQASLNRRDRQLVSGRCRTMEVIHEQSTGNYFRRNGQPRYYTAQLYASVFFIEKPVCGETDIVKGALEQRGKGRMEQHKAQLKQLIFNPGTDIQGVPFMGRKAAIFDPEVSNMYDFKLSSVEYGGEACYLFEAVPKAQYAGDVVYNQLATWFRKTDYSIVARDYALSFKTLLYDFDVRMQVRLTRVGGRLLPTRITYDGNWHVATQDRERVRFEAEFVYGE